MSLAFRRAEERDMPLIIDSWLSSFADAHAAGVIPMHLYRRVYHESIVWIMKRPGVELWVAFHPGEADTMADLYGWICIERDHPTPVIHYCFVKQAFRKMGIATGLLAAVRIDGHKPLLYTFKTGVAAEIARTRSSAKWSPLTARFPRQTPDIAQ